MLTQKKPSAQLTILLPAKGQLSSQIKSFNYFFSLKMCDCDQSYFAFLERYKLYEGERYVLKLLSLQESGIGFRNILFLWLIVLVLHHIT